ncbi:hypothetical protein BHE74_00032411 [Ensete ventricosum]|nr:hypothetical protein BHE74_00032411 [Ensete ventricosum]
MVGAAAPAGGSPLRVRRGQPLAGWPLATVPCGRITGIRPYGLVVPMPAGGRPLRHVALAGDRPLQFKTNLSHENFGSDTTIEKPTAGASHAEIVYPCIPYPNGEDEGGQASSTLAISIRWISVAKLLQSDLATLAQREGGE